MALRLKTPLTCLQTLTLTAKVCVENKYIVQATENVENYSLRKSQINYNGELMFLVKGSDQCLNLDLIVKTAQTDAAKAAKYHASNLMPPILKSSTNETSIKPAVSLF